MKQISLSGHWQFREAGTDRWLGATVPGTVHTDLLANGIIEDPFYRDNFRYTQWIEDKDWEYETWFELDEQFLQMEVLELVFDGLDTVANVYLNEALIFQADNMYQVWTREVREHLKPGKNQLRVYFKSAVHAALDACKSSPFQYPAINDKGQHKVSPFLRRIPYSFGWDWCPRMVGCGIWKSVYLRGWNQATIKSVYIRTTSLDEESAKLNLELELLSTFRGRGFISIWNEGSLLGGMEVKMKKGPVQCSTELVLREPRLWWPVGLGKANLYRLKVVLENEAEILDEFITTTGLRTIELVKEEDQKGKSFYFKVNGMSVFMKGANLVPLDFFPHRVQKENYQQLILAAREANMNMLRVWGGGLYESDYFYEQCDENGILVWQDFMFACAMYPASQNFLHSIEGEATTALKRLRTHCCIALWCGNNEVLEGYHAWNWQEEIGKIHHKQAFSEYQKIFHEVLPKLVSVLDPGRPYHPSSPSAGDLMAPSVTRGDFHFWDFIKSDLPVTVYQETVGRFMSEYGFKAYPEQESLAAFTKAEDRSLYNEVLETHQGWAGGAAMMERALQREMPPASDFESFCYHSQVLQARVLQMAIEAHRVNRPGCMGSLLWQFNDCWPAASWALIDYYSRRKAAYYQVKRSFAPVLLVVSASNKLLQVSVVSDLLRPFNGDLSIELIDFSGKLKRKHIQKITVAPNSVSLAYSNKLLDWMRDIDPQYVVLACRITEKKQLHAESTFYFRSDRYLSLPVPEIDMETELSGRQLHIKLHSKMHARAVFLTHPTAGVFSDNGFDLLPGQVKILDFTPAGKTLADPVLLKYRSVISVCIDD